jgi:hypothetical protein
VDAVSRGELGEGSTLAQMCLDQVAPDVHPETPSTWCLRRLDASGARVSRI